MSILPRLIPALLLQLLLYPAVPVYAAEPAAAGQGGMSSEQMRQMQQMMQNNKKLLQCYKNIDKKPLDRLEKEGKAVEDKINDLCKAGRRDEAQAAAMAYARKVEGSKEVKEFRKCSEMADGMMGNISTLMQESREQLQNGNVCDSE